MSKTASLAVIAVAAVALLAACESSTVSSPRAPGAATFDRVADGAACLITLPAPAHRPLPAVREVTRELNEAFSKPSASVNCGTINGIGERLNTLVSKLDQVDGEQNLDAACGIAGSLFNELDAMVRLGKFNPIVTHPPQASPNVVENMDFIRGEFCRNAGR